VSEGKSPGYQKNSGGGASEKRKPVQGKGGFTLGNAREAGSQKSAQAMDSKSFGGTWQWSELMGGGTDGGRVSGVSALNRVWRGNSHSNRD